MQILRNYCLFCRSHCSEHEKFPSVYSRTDSTACVQLQRPVQKLTLYTVRPVVLTWNFVCVLSNNLGHHFVNAIIISDVNKVPDVVYLINVRDSKTTKLVDLTFTLMYRFHTKYRIGALTKYSAPKLYELLYFSTCYYDTSTGQHAGLA